MSNYEQIFKLNKTKKTIKTTRTEKEEKEEEKEKQKRNKKTIFEKEKNRYLVWVLKALTFVVEHSELVDDLLALLILTDNPLKIDINKK